MHLKPQQLVQACAIGSLFISILCPAQGVAPGAAPGVGGASAAVLTANRPGILYVTVPAPRWYPQAIARDFFVRGGINLTPATVANPAPAPGSGVPGAVAQTRRLPQNSPGNLVRVQQRPLRGNPVSPPATPMVSQAQRLPAR